MKFYKNRNTFWISGINGLKTQAQLIMSIYEGLSHLDWNRLYIPELQKDYFIRDNEKRKGEHRLMVQESKQLIKRLKKAHRERSGILTLEDPNEVGAELAKLLGESKKLKKGTPVTLEELEAKNVEEFTSRVAQIIS